MFKISGSKTSASVYSDRTEQYAIDQIKKICDNDASAGSRICIMPDVHPARPVPVGLTMTTGNHILPSFVGSDIGCGVSYVQIRETNIEFLKLDRIIRERIPFGSRLRKEIHARSEDFAFADLICRKHIDEEKAGCSLGTLGSGNHFIELGKDDDGSLYLFVHSGSRRLGKEASEFYLRQGQKNLQKRGEDVPYEKTYLTGQLKDDYLHDLGLITEYAQLNRELILAQIVKCMKWKISSFGGCIHNYVDEHRILRKGAVAAYDGDEVVIPINMKDGIIMAQGRGNPAWNFSAPHGGGRIMSRAEVKNHHTVSQFKRSMKGIYSSTIGSATLDEAPFAYRGIDEIAAAIGETVTITKVIRPIYNFKG